MSYVIFFTWPLPPPPWRSPDCADWIPGQTLIRAPSWVCWLRFFGYWGQTYRCIAHGDVVDVNVFYYIVCSGVLAERSNGDSVGAIADQVLVICQLQYLGKTSCLWGSLACTTISVLFGLKDTQSSPLSIREFWIVIAEERYVSHPSFFPLAGVSTSEGLIKRIRNTSVLSSILARTLPRNINVIINNISRIDDNVIPLRTISHF